MRHATDFHVVRQQRDPTPAIEILRAATGQSITLDAAQLVAQYATASGDILLILDEDCPYEEQLHLVLVRGDAVIDHLVLGAPYATGIFREVDNQGDTLCFRFSVDEELRVHAPPHRLPVPSRSPPGVRRKTRWGRSGATIRDTDDRLVIDVDNSFVTYLQSLPPLDEDIGPIDDRPPNPASL